VWLRVNTRDYIGSELFLFEVEGCTNMDVVFHIPHYPSLMDPEIREKLCRKKEFYDIYSKLSRYRENPALFQRTDLYRDFICKFLAPHTPYDRCLVIHAVGTGKTGCAIRIVEQYKKTFKRAVILNKSDTPTNNFQNLLTIHFEQMGLSERDIRQEKEFYVFDTYNKFAKQISRLSDSKIVEDYECTVFILDEVHNVVTRTHDTDEAVYTVLMDLFDILENCVVVGLTATPMRDQYTEFIPLINMFIKNPSNRIRTDPNSFEDVRESLIQTTKSCVSWYTEEFAYDRIDIGMQLLSLHMTVIPLEMGLNQRMAYAQLDISNEIQQNNKVNNFMDKGRTYASLGAFESEGADIKESIIQTFQSYDNKRAVSFEIIEEVQSILSNPHETSCKFAYTMEQIECDEYYYTKRNEPKPPYWPSHSKLCDGLVYIFCEDIANTGVKMIIALFKLFGYEYYVGGDINSLEANYRRFTTYVGDKNICSNGNERLSLFCDRRNLDGRYCKIIIASNVMKESVSLKGVRKVFIWTPHWNYSSVIQAQGRALRKDAFVDILDKGQKNIEIHRLVSVADFRKLSDILDMHRSVHDIQELCRSMRRVSIDLYKYYKSSLKQDEMDLVENILSTMSLDNYVIVNPDNMPEFDEGLDMSTAVQYDDDVMIRVKDSLYDFLSEGAKHLHDVVDYIMTTEDMEGDVILQYIDTIIDKRESIRDKMMTPHFFHINNDILYVSRQPITDGFSIPMGDEMHYTKPIDPYIDRGEYKFPDFNWKVDRRTVADNIDDVYPCIVDICESAVSGGYTNIINMFPSNVHYILGNYFHILERSRYSSTRYSNTSKSIQNTVLVKHYDNGEWKFVDDNMRNLVGKRIDFINRFRSLKMIVEYSIYGSISVTDGQFRVHNYITHRIDDRKDRILQFCDRWIQTLTTERNVPYDTLEDFEKICRKDIIAYDTIDRRNDMRGRNIETFGRKQIAITEVSLLVKALKTKIPIPKTIMYMGTFVETEYLDTNLLESDTYIDILRNQYPEMEREILLKYTEIISTRDVQHSRNRVRDIIMNNDLYIFE
jgi:superfamily II DNA or RNA helicase